MTVYESIRRRAAAEAKRTSLRAVARAAGISHSQLSRWLAGKRGLGAEAFGRLHDLLEGKR